MKYLKILIFIIIGSMVLSCKNKPSSSSSKDITAELKLQLEKGKLDEFINSNLLLSDGLRIDSCYLGFFSKENYLVRSTTEISINKLDINNIQVEEVSEFKSTTGKKHNFHRITIYTTLKDNSVIWTVMNNSSDKIVQQDKMNKIMIETDYRNSDYDSEGTANNFKKAMELLIAHCAEKG